MFAGAQVASFVSVPLFVSSFKASLKSGLPADGGVWSFLSSFLWPRRYSFTLISLSEKYVCGKEPVCCIKWSLRLIAWKTDKVLRIWILSNLFHKLPIRVLELCMDNQSLQRRAQRLCDITSITWEQCSILVSAHLASRYQS